MRLRTKLFLTYGLAVLVLLVAMTWPIQLLVAANFDRLADHDFTGTRQGLRGLQSEHVERLRQIGTMVMEIPELRALIAEHNFEVSSDNLNNLQDRLNSLTSVMGVGFICVLDGHGTIVAQNAGSPWASLADIREFAAHSTQPHELIRNLYRPSPKQADSEVGEYGLWLYHDQLYQVVGLPLTFDADQRQAAPDGALIMAAPVTGEMVHHLASTHNCELSFLTVGGGLTSSLSADLGRELRAAYNGADWKSSATFDTTLGGTVYRSYVEPLVDPCSRTTLGATLIQTSMAEGLVLQTKISHSLFAIMIGGLLATAVVSFWLSGAITRPVHVLLDAVRRVASGDLSSTLPDHTARDEFGELAAAFNNMVIELRTQRQRERPGEESHSHVGSAVLIATNPSGPDVSAGNRSSAKARDTSGVGFAP
jgi:HAMP domain-containing protein